MSAQIPDPLDTRQGMVMIQNHTFPPRSDTSKTIRPILNT